jgi:hypothetical protein
MNALVIILNNGGIGAGPTEWDEDWDKPYGALSMPVYSQGRPDTAYENLTETFGGKKWYARLIIADPPMCDPLVHSLTHSCVIRIPYVQDGHYSRRARGCSPRGTLHQ